MTLDYATKEAQRRTAELGTVHHVAIRSTSNADNEYLVLTTVPKGFSSLISFSKREPVRAL